ncbi:MAG: hypothetical protein HY011_18975 [Acidobacteria bacterium]|nr:hypothetical protein [Acidobacteriota bacterium]
MPQVPAINLRAVEDVERRVEQLFSMLHELRAVCTELRCLPRPLMSGPEVQKALGLSATTYADMVRRGVLKPLRGMDGGKGTVKYFPRHIIEALGRGERVEWPAGCLPEQSKN